MSIVALITAVLGFFRDLFAWKRSEDDRRAGADALRADQQRQKDAILREANEAEVEADKAHKTMPDDEAFDKEFRRD